MSGKTSYEYNGLGKVGSFWSELTTDGTKDLARSIIALASTESTTQDMTQILRSPVGHKRVVVRDAINTFNLRHVHYIGPDLIDKWRGHSVDDDTTPITLVRYDRESRVTTESVLSLGDFDFGVDGSQYYLTVITDPEDGEYQLTNPVYTVPLRPNYYPLTVRTGEPEPRILCQNVDFFLGEGLMFFRESPTSLFPDGHMHVVGAVTAIPPLHNFVTKQEQGNYSNKFTLRYARGDQSISSLLRAAAESAGYFVFEESDTVLTVSTQGDTTYYTTAKYGTIVIDYDHDPIPIGHVYEGYVVSPGLRIISSADGDNWWKLSTHIEGYDLNGYRVNNGLITVSLINDKLSMNVGVVNQPLESLINSMTYNRVIEGDDLPTLLGLTNGISKQLNLLEFAAAFYGPRLLIWDWDSTRIDSTMLSRLLAFIEREKPVQCITILPIDNRDDI